jgi:SAM-dependent methyltransferase
VTEHDASVYGSLVTDVYDELYQGVYDTAGAVACLAELAAGGPVLELGVGTGRIAIPLAAHGLEVHGVDGSPEMLAALAKKPGAETIKLTLGDFSTVRLDERFAVVALVVNTIFALPDQASQVRCFERAAEHLRPGGRFVIEAWVPEPLPAGVSLRPRKLAEGHVGLVVSEHDPARQVLSTTQVALGGAVGVRVFPVVHRYAWPSELDLMAQIAGLACEDRWSDWHGSPFDATSTSHVSVYQRRV